MEIKEHIFRDFIDLNPLRLWDNLQLRRDMCLNITEVVAEVGEQLYHYSTVTSNDLIYLKKGSIQAYCHLDHSQHFPCHYQVPLHSLRMGAFSMHLASSPTSVSAASGLNSKATASSTSSGGMTSNRC